MIYKFIFWDFFYLSKIVIILCLLLKYEICSIYLFDEIFECVYVVSMCGMMKVFFLFISLFLIIY